MIAPKKRLYVRSNGALIGKAATLFALGKTHAEIDKALNLRSFSSQDFGHKYRDLWTAAVDRAMVKVADALREQAGTLAVLDSPRAHLKKGLRAIRWMSDRGQELFPGDGRMRLTELYRDHYAVVRLADAAKSTLNWHQQVFRHWIAITGNPAIEDLSVSTLALFRDTLLCTHKPNTVWGYLAFIQGVLDRAGPPEPRRRDCLGILTRVPWVKPPKKLFHQRKAASPEEVERLYLACDQLRVPRVGGLKPAAWWRALLVLLFYTGLRYGTVRKLKFAWIDWGKGLLSIPPEATKTGIGLDLPLPKICLEHLAAIRTDRVLVFEGLRYSRSFYPQWGKLQAAAGIPEEDRFGTHAIRRMLATLLWELEPQAAQLCLGHTNTATTRRHYVMATRIVARALDRLPVPVAFGGALAVEGGAQ